MTTRIQDVNPLQLATVLSVLYLFGGLLEGLFFWIISLYAPQSGNGTVFTGALMIVFLPIFGAIVGFLGGLIGAALYNLVAGWTGGIEITLTVPNPSPQPTPTEAQAA